MELLPIEEWFLFFWLPMYLAGWLTITIVEKLNIARKDI